MGKNPVEEFVFSTPALCSSPTHASQAPAHDEANMSPPPYPTRLVTSTAALSRSYASPPRVKCHSHPISLRLLFASAKRTCYLVLASCSAKRPDTDLRQYILTSCICPTVQTQPPLRVLPPQDAPHLTAPMHLIYLALDISPSFMPTLRPAPIPASRDVPPLHEAHDFRRPTSFASAAYEHAMPRRLMINLRRPPFIYYLLGSPSFPWRRLSNLVLVSCFLLPASCSLLPTGVLWPSSLPPFRGPPFQGQISRTHFASRAWIRYARLLCS